MSAPKKPIDPPFFSGPGIYPRGATMELLEADFGPNSSPAGTTTTTTTSPPEGTKNNFSASASNGTPSSSSSGFVPPPPPGPPPPSPTQPPPPPPPIAVRVSLPPAEGFFMIAERNTDCPCGLCEKISPVFY
jgi:hypothetical protein